MSRRLITAPISTVVTRRINYDDNIFYIQSLIKGLRSGLRLDIDPDYFRDKIVEDIFFVDRTIQQIYDALKVNDLLINRIDHLREIIRAKRAFCDFLDEAAGDALPFSPSLEAFGDKLTSARETHARDIVDIQGVMEGRSTGEEPKNIVSNDEYRFLFQDEESES